jgi:parvulin-like peptidyl-prolyl isomerase
LKAGGDFAKLAKKYSKDPGSAAQGGKLTITKGQTVAPFDKVAFSLKTNELSPPVHTTYGWHIIQALSAVKPATQQPLKDVKAQISSQLLQTKKTDVINKWVDDVNKEYAKKIAYQTGYTPLATTAPTTTAATTTNQ